MLNVIVLMGRLTADPELRHTTANIAVTTFTLAVDRSYVKSGEERKTDFIDVVCWRATADFVTKYFKKGQLVAVQGAVQTRSYTDKEGNKRKAFEVVADNVHFAESKRDTAANTGGQYNNYNNPQAQNAQAAPSYSNAGSDDFEVIQGDDDLPF